MDDILRWLGWIAATRVEQTDGNWGNFIRWGWERRNPSYRI